MGQDRDPLGIVGSTVADKYAIESVIGHGGFAVVYRATHVLWKRPVAVKVFNALAEISGEQRQRLLEDFIQEGALLAELSERSTAICQARDVGMLTAPGGVAVPYMVLEWLEGRSLDAIIDAERASGAPLRSLVEAVHLLDPVADALALAHRKGIAHRDVKPANVFVLEDASGAVSGVKLLDFGIAKVVQDAQKMGFGKTAGHMTAFTPLYGAPEQFNRSYGATGPWTDVFALALVVAELASGREPMAGDDLVQLGFAAANPAKRPTPRTLGVATSDDVEAVFRKALAVRPEERFQTAGEFWSVLRERVLADPTARAGARRVAASVPASANAETLAAPESANAPAKSAGTAEPGVGAPGSDTSGARGASSSRGARLGALALGAAALAAGVSYVATNRPSSSSPPSAPSASVAPVPSEAPASAVAPEPSSARCPAGMVFIPGGDFFMGSDDPSADDDERPAHRVTLSPYCLDAHEVTVAEYKRCSDSGACLRAGRANVWPGIKPAQRKIYDPLCNENDPVGRAEHPVNCVDHEQAETFCRIVRGGRLPTEAEWELAARGPDQRIYPWGDEAPSADHLNACGKECLSWADEHPDPDGALSAMYEQDDGWPHTAPVGSFPQGSSRYGVADIVGNVWEWVSDWYGPYPKAKTTPVDPTGPAKGTKRVIRGGAWNGSQPSWVRPAFRFSATPETRNYGFGFRCARELERPRP